MSRIAVEEEGATSVSRTARSASRLSLASSRSSSLSELDSRVSAELTAKGSDSGEGKLMPCEFSARTTNT